MSFSGQGSSQITGPVNRRQLFVNRHTEADSLLTAQKRKLNERPLLTSARTLQTIALWAATGLSVLCVETGTADVRSEKLEGNCR